MHRQDLSTNAHQIVFFFTVRVGYHFRSLVLETLKWTTIQGLQGHQPQKFCEGKHRQSLDQNLVIQISSEELIFQAFHCHFSSQDWSPSALMTNQMHMDIHWLLLRQTVAPCLLVQCRNLTKFRKRDQPTQASCTMLVSGSFFGYVRTIKKKLKS